MLLFFPPMLILLAQEFGRLLVVPCYFLKGFVGQSVFEQLEVVYANQTVAAAYFVLQETKGPPGVVAFEPKGYLTEFNRIGVEVHAVDTVFNDFAQTGAHLRGGRLIA